MQFNAIALLTTTLLAGAQASAIPASAPAVVPQDAVPVFEGSGAELAGLKAKRDGKYEWAVVLGLYSDYSCGAGQRDNTKPDGTCYPMGDNDKGMKIFWLAQGCRVLIKGPGGCGSSGGQWHSNLNQCIPLRDLWYYQVYC
ncbi:hypothetical protein MCOR27_001990 [Pyricularia oryzae]|uniref:Uncharacterized protein n=5 Tax=Pyricularia TaxID=48558 RepID=A0ABQ8NVX8_PYRGI|nr:uncharacterized protein MGG_04258 [Pyricularia oryzae 70-15]ELQ33188.1 hypothetical protein OOU_Y34scaffold00991g3 [Pyricularia oryzae Y34]KAH8845694.1 hypothetical protein MCOR01_002927 [Pyricularia oryzae]KAI6302926.1 hypothetical protein MCOR33_001836 [Pyricularia grisea]EHA47187.1 hypothetical protein MGG_04258 [Pyricularia oryzae 70-15]KAH9432800.1 hypothetical protein MCOR02_007479 [Pyricularia oryzae]